MKREGGSGRRDGQQKFECVEVYWECAGVTVFYTNEGAKIQLKLCRGCWDLQLHILAITINGYHRQSLIILSNKI